MKHNRKILVTGGAGFIGSNFVQEAVSAGEEVVNVDLLTYAGNAENLANLEDNPRHILVQADICNGDAIAAILQEHRPSSIVHFAAESHVDRSIVSPDAFIRTNVQGTFILLEQARQYWMRIERERSRRIQVSARVHGRSLWLAGRR